MRKIYILILFHIFIHQICVSQTKETRDIDSIKRLIQLERKDLRLAYLNDLLAREYLELNGDSVMKYAKQSLVYSVKIKNYEYQVDAKNTIGMSNRKTGNFDESQKYHFEALKIAKTHKLANHYFYTTYSAMCLAFSEQGNYSAAIEYGYKALHATEIEKDTLNMAIVNNNLANIFFENANYEKAQLHYRKALNVAILLGNQYGQALITSNLGSVFYQSGNLDSAKYYFDQSIIIDKQIEDVVGEAINYLNLGSYYQKKKDYKSAIESFFKAEKTFKEQEMDPNLADIYFNLADVNYEIGNYVVAKQFGEKSLAIADKIHGLTQQEAAHLILSKILEKLHNPSAAYEQYKSYIIFRDSLSNDNNKKEQFKAELEYEYVKRKYTDSLDQVLYQKVQQEALTQEKEKTQAQQKFTYMASIGCVIFLVLSLFIYKGYKDKKAANHIIVEQKNIAEYQRELLDVKQKEILDSIHYAKRIQNTLLAHHDFLDEHLPENFILFKPKDIVSGDFYWAAEHDDKFYLAVCDCTGHGVPGAFMSLLNIGFLSESVKEKHISQPHKILNYIRKRLIESISNDGQQDGMDAILICKDTTSNTITYAAANNEPVLIRNGEIVALPKDRMPVGKGEKTESFNLQTIDVKKGDVLYLYTDGYADQFGGEKGKKFKYKSLNELLLSIADKDMNYQKNILDETFINWKGNLEQVDDVLIVGIKI